MENRVVVEAFARQLLEVVNRLGSKIRSELDDHFSKSCRDHTNLIAFFRTFELGFFQAATGRVRVFQRS